MGSIEATLGARLASEHQAKPTLRKLSRLQRITVRSAEPRRQVSPCDLLSMILKNHNFTFVRPCRARLSQKPETSRYSLGWKLNEVTAPCESNPSEIQRRSRRDVKEADESNKLLRCGPCADPGPEACSQTRPSLDSRLAIGDPGPKNRPELDTPTFGVKHIARNEVI